MANIPGRPTPERGGPDVCRDGAFVFSRNVFGDFPMGRLASLHHENPSSARPARSGHTSARTSGSAAGWRTLDFRVSCQTMRRVHPGRSRACFMSDASICLTPSILGRNGPARDVFETCFFKCLIINVIFFCLMGSGVGVWWDRSARTRRSGRWAHCQGAHFLGLGTIGLP